MDHANASPLLSDYAFGRLDGTRAEAVRGHVQACGECRDVLAAMNDVRAEIRDHGSALFTDHPGADDLARWAQAPREVSDPARTEIEAHVRACPTCSQEATLARDAAATAWQRALAGRFARSDEARGSVWVRALPVAVAVLLAFPAYLGLVELPRERARASREVPRSQPVTPRQDALPWSGAAKTLVLSGPTRGAGAVPSIRPEPGQPYIPIVLAIEGLPRTGMLRISVIRADGPVAWRSESAVAAVWDPVNRVASLLVPTASVPPGDYRIEVGRAERSGALFSASFRVRPERG